MKLRVPARLRERLGGGAGSEAALILDDVSRTKARLLLLRYDSCPMSIFGFYFVGNLLSEAGWPRREGLFRRRGYDTTIADAAIVQMVNWGASLGAGLPSLALQVIAEMFRDRSWENENAPQIARFVAGARSAWDSAAGVAPTDIVKPLRLALSFGTSIKSSDFQDRRLRAALEQLLLEAVLWGLANPDRFTAWYIEAARHHESSLGFMRSAGLSVDALPSLSALLENSEQIVRRYEQEFGPLPSIPARLLSDAQVLGVRIG